MVKTKETMKISRIKDCNNEELFTGDYVTPSPDSSFTLLSPNLDLLKVAKVYKEPFKNGTNMSGKVVFSKCLNDLLKDTTFPINSKYVRKVGFEEFNKFDLHEMTEEELKAEIERIKKEKGLA